MYSEVVSAAPPERPSVRMEFSAVLNANVATWYLRNPLFGNSRFVLALAGAELSVGCRAKGALFLDNFLARDGYKGNLSNLRLGSKCYVGESVYIDLAGPVDIGECAMISACCRLLTHQNAHRSPYVHERFPPRVAGVSIGAGSWVGAGATIMPGVMVGQESVVGAGALVVRDVRPRTLVVGSPARELRDL